MERIGGFIGESYEVDVEFLDGEGLLSIK